MLPTTPMQYLIDITLIIVTVNTVNYYHRRTIVVTLIHLYWKENSVSNSVY